jgi:RNA polymerase-binding protein DksA
MTNPELARFHERLIRMRDRLTSESNHVFEALAEEHKPASGLPTHLADAATESLDTDLETLATEQSMINDIQAALSSIADGTYGQCKQCESSIGTERLEAIPYATLCIACARKVEASAA